MPEKIPASLKGVSTTLLMTLYARARETLHPDSILKDEKAIELVKKIDFDFPRVQMQRRDEIAILIRMNKFDSHVRNFLQHNQDGIVVHIGCGLDFRFERVDNGQVEWFDLDLPDVISLRKRLSQNGNCRYHTLPVSVFDDHWMDEVNRYNSRPFMFVAEGVLPYFTESQVKALFLKLRDRFTDCQMVCDAHSPFIVWLYNLRLAGEKMKARLKWGLQNGRQVESWAEGIRLLDEWTFYDADERRIWTLRLARLFPPLARSSGIFHYRLSKPPAE